MSPQEVLRRSRRLAQVALSASLAELRHEAENGLDRERIARFAGLAQAADDVLSAEVTVPRAEPRSERAKVVKTVTKSGPAIDRPAQALAVLREAKGWVSTAALAQKLGIPPGHVSGTINRLKARGAKVLSERGKGYRVEA